MRPEGMVVVVVVEVIVLRARWLKVSSFFLLHRIGTQNSFWSSLGVTFWVKEQRTD